MQTLRAGTVILPMPMPFDCQVYYGTTLLRRYQDYHPVFMSGSSDMLAMNIWTQIPQGTVLTIKGGCRTLQAKVK
jgi:predicted glutamine amidotransferase